jgi:hypothetical protein
MTVPDGDAHGFKLLKFPCPSPSFRGLFIVAFSDAVAFWVCLGGGRSFSLTSLQTAGKRCPEGQAGVSPLLSYHNSDD